MPLTLVTSFLHFLLQVSIFVIRNKVRNMSAVVFRYVYNIMKINVINL